MHRTTVASAGWRFLAFALALAVTPTQAGAQESFVNFETPHVHPMDLSPGGNTLAVVNTADNRLELFDVRSGRPVALGAVTVGLDPVSVRFRSDSVAWVVNHVSDSVSVVHVPTRRILATVPTLDEPADVVFAGFPERAFVSCSQANSIRVFDPDALGRAPVDVPIDAEEPRALAVSPDGSTVYAAIFESGNATTILSGGNGDPTFEIVNAQDGPYGGRNPPPNRGEAFEPPIRNVLPDPPPVSLIVRKSGDGRWLDDNGGDWTEFISGSQADRTEREPGWDLADRDVAVIDAEDLSVDYIRRLMNIDMALAVNPVTGWIYVVGTDATNEIRWEPNLNGRFLRVQVARAHPKNFQARLRDLNPHLTYDVPTVPRSRRERSLGDPRAIVWNEGGTRAWVAGMGSSNVVAIDRLGRRVGDPIEVGQGPTGLALDRVLDRLYVLNRFDASISVVDLADGREIERVGFFDPTPRVIREGRPFLYDTHRTSGLGHVSCASCHVDARLDRLAWDLGDPTGRMKSQEGQNTGFVEGDRFRPWHPMKGPMVTQTLQDIIGKEPFHWRGDRDGLEEFNGAFVGLLGDDRELTAEEMQQFEAFLATIHFPPNPYRNLDNSLPTDLPIPESVFPGELRHGRFGRGGEPLPNGNAVRGLAEYSNPDRVFCATCHTLPLGSGTTMARDGDGFVEIPAGPNGEQHLAVIGFDASFQLGWKIPHLRNLYERVGYTTNQRPLSRAGFGFLHDGTRTTLARFVASPGFDLTGDQETADFVALLLAFSGSDLTPNAQQPPGAASRDAHAAVGRQVTISAPDQAVEDIAALVELARSGAVDLVVKGKRGARERGWFFRRADGRFLADERGRGALAPETLVRIAAPKSRLTFLAVPRGSGRRIGIDRDADGVLDFDE